ncbi:head-tail adaptor protein [Sinorhizobium sp. BJ1]|uniref:head-tail adaptor protein n=1 Tax=Sinorhizobium sp. BJ1 TaxID=2035455 RepID=UPI000BEA6CA0|nr:head-tail adaptor protein [Sinorhizobium sp. BJ1]PDT79959.1 phage head-tail adapter protein [Sinorhizobium sp. BJ1]
MTTEVRALPAGKLTECVSLYRRGELDDGYGNTVTDWILQFDAAAGYTHLRGGETVMAARLTNRHPVVIRIRTSTAARPVTAEWKLVDKRSLVEYAIKDVTHDVDRKYIDLLCERGVAV